MGKGKHGGYASAAQRKAVHASKNERKDGASQKKFPEIDKKIEGKFTAWVKKNMPGKSTCAAASTVVKNKKKYKPAVVKMANYANNFGCKASKKSGASFNPKLKQAVADGTIKGKFADAIMAKS